MIPRLEDVLRSVVWTFEEHIAPAAADPYAQSLSRTVSFLLRQALARVEHEEQGLRADNVDLREVLSAVRLQLLSDGARFGRSLSALDSALQYSPVDDPRSRVVDVLAQEAFVLREALTTCQRALRGSRKGKTAANYHARQLIQAYLRRHLERESLWMEPAFEGPRR